MDFNFGIDSTSLNEAGKRVINQLCDTLTECLEEVSAVIASDPEAVKSCYSEVCCVISSFVRLLWSNTGLIDCLTIPEKELSQKADAPISENESAIEQKVREVNGKSVITYETQIPSACVMEFEAGTNGLHGGDTGHGGRTYIRIEDLSSTDIVINPIWRGNYLDESGVEILLGGDCELSSIIEGLKFIVKTLKMQIRTNGMIERALK